MSDSAIALNRLDASMAEDIAAFGGKACGLIRLMRAGLTVPPAWILESSAPEPSGEEIASLWDEIAREAGSAAGLRVAVRSSATVEDTGGSSAAGVYETILGVADTDALAAAISTCRASLDHGRASSYRNARDQTDRAAMAVVIQIQIDSEVAGVLMTTNPRRPFADELVIDAAYGLGEGVVSGAVDPDHLVIDRESGETVEERIGAKATKIALAPPGADTGKTAIVVDVAAPDRDRSALTDSQLKTLRALAADLEDQIGDDQDCEWAIADETLYALQVRPITGLPPKHPKDVYSRRFGDEYLSSWTSPLGHTYLTRWITEWMFNDMARRMGRSDLAKIDPLLRYHGYVYISGDYVRRVMEALPKGMRSGGPQDWFTPLWDAEIKDADFSPLALARMVTLPLFDKRGPMAKNIKSLESHCKRIEERVAPKLDQDYTALSHSEWRDQMDEINEFGAEHFRVIRWGMGQHSATLHSLLQGLLRAWSGDRDGEIYREVVSGLPGTRTAEINRDIWSLGIEARSISELRDSILKGGDNAEIRRNVDAPDFWKHFDEFLAAHGHRSTSREIAEPRWVETPDLIIGFIRAQLHSDSPPIDPLELESAAVARREYAERQALDAARSGVTGAIRKPILTSVIRKTQDFTLYRENQRYHLDYLLAHCRKLVLEMARRLEVAGVIGDKSEIFFMEADEMFAQAKNPDRTDELRDAIADRIDDWRIWKDRLPATYLFDGVETEGEIVEGKAGRPSESSGEDANVGLGASRGSARGSARVVTHVDDLENIEPGEILVAETIDPGWTSVFPLLGGLITETGGLLSHGALLAREYGIPAVMAIPDATTRIETGALIEIDGSAGSVTFVE